MILHLTSKYYLELVVLLHVVAAALLAATSLESARSVGLVCCTPGSGRFVLNVTVLRRYSRLSGTDELRDVAALSEATADLS